MLEIKQNESLSKHCTFRIGGPAGYFAVAKSSEEILEAVKLAEDKKLPFFILGGGSNILFNDKGFGGVIIKVNIGGISLDGERVVAGAGVLLSQVMNFSADNGLSGLEWSVGIPGTIGGAVNGNAGAYGRSVSEAVESVEVLSEEKPGEWNVKNYSKEECRFKYRRSKFKHIGNREIITKVVLKFDKSDKEKTRQEIKNILMARTGKVPPRPSAGCVFKNIKKENGDLVASIGKLVDQCGIKGTRVGGAEIPVQHGNYIVNMGGATSGDVKELIRLCKGKVKEKFGYELEEEIIVM
ncbi:MAG: UDP-N-acetylmuramate dehydrogenase [Candidatus Pacebacteria bacterium]|nr:UDP-N-acetylmuramate dehydrogenase [Candidatus Paceibacterota bacterium]NUQ56931.1 UDP-N-acetylmuramate dehydrogenase [Candidatus Paceibacter sp.]